jgi:hypothetical protein
MSSFLTSTAQVGAELEASELPPCDAIARSACANAAEVSAGHSSRCSLVLPKRSMLHTKGSAHDVARGAPELVERLIDGLDDNDVELSIKELDELDDALVDPDRAAERGHLIPHDEVLAQMRQIS